jgi:hypothetical protein
MRAKVRADRNRRNIAVHSEADRKPAHAARNVIAGLGWRRAPSAYALCPFWKNVGANARTLRAGLEAKAFIKSRIIVAHVSLGAIFSFCSCPREGRTL